jgi:membrane-bound metal-dependent hydrolase YbcI (DUF457 family)
MFIGHFAVGLAAKRVVPTVSLATLFVAVQFADVLWPFLLAAGVEEVEITADPNPFLRPVFVHYPFSHSLLFLVFWGLLFGLIWRTRTRVTGPFPGLLLVSLVVSHWVLDVVTHRPDMPLYPGSSRYGLGLWNSPALTLAVEVPLYIAGAGIYAATTRARDRIGVWGFWSLIVFLLVAYLASLTGPPPPSLTALYGTAIVASLLIVAWAWWADKHRDPVPRRT